MADVILPFSEEDLQIIYDLRTWIDEILLAIESIDSFYNEFYEFCLKRKYEEFEYSLNDCYFYKYSTNGYSYEDAPRIAGRLLQLTKQKFDVSGFVSLILSAKKALKNAYKWLPDRPERESVESLDTLESDLEDWYTITIIGLSPPDYNYDELSDWISDYFYYYINYDNKTRITSNALPSPKPTASGTVTLSLPSHQLALAAPPPPPGPTLRLDDLAVALFHRQSKSGSKITVAGLARALETSRTLLYDQKTCPTFTSLWRSYKAKMRPESKGRRKARPLRDDD